MVGFGGMAFKIIDFTRFDKVYIITSGNNMIKVFVLQWLPSKINDVAGFYKVYIVASGHNKRRIFVCFIRVPVHFREKTVRHFRHDSVNQLIYISTYIHTYIYIHICTGDIYIYMYIYICCAAYIYIYNMYVYVYIFICISIVYV